MSLGFIRPVVLQAPKAAPLEMETISRPTRRPSYLLLCALSALVVTFASLFGWAYASWRHAAYCEDLVANGAWVSATTCGNATHCLGTDGIYYTGALSEHDCHSHWSETLSTTSDDGRRRLHKGIIECVARAEVARAKVARAEVPSLPPFFE